MALFPTPLTLPLSRFSSSAGSLNLIHSRSTSLLHLLLLLLLYHLPSAVSLLSEILIDTRLHAAAVALRGLPILRASVAISRHGRLSLSVPETLPPRINRRKKKHHSPPHYSLAEANPSYKDDSQLGSI